MHEQQGHAPEGEAEEEESQAKRRKIEVDVGMMRKLIEGNPCIMSLMGQSPDMDKLHPPRFQDGGHESRNPLKSGPSRKGFALDLLTNDADGKPCDFEDSKVRLRALRLVRQERPRLLVGSHMYAWSSNMRALGREKAGESKYQEGLQRATRHIEFTCRLYREQRLLGGFILHEHPAGDELGIALHEGTTQP